MPAPTGDDDPATRRELQRTQELLVATFTARLAELRTEMIERIDALRTEMIERIQAVRTEMIDRFAAQERRMSDRFVELERRMNDRFAAQERRISNQTRVLLLAMAAMWGTLLAAMYRLS